MASRQARSVFAAVEILLRHRDDRSDGVLLREFLDLKSEAAFAMLVRRHGPMVLGVCRRILGNDADADDAAQATFLVLATKAHSLKSRTTLGDWLHEVARRTASGARRCDLRRREMEKRIVRPTPREDVADMLPILDEELARLPEKYRLPIVLCDLEGQSRKTAAEQLRWPEGSVASRLARGRQLLAKRLAKRGVALTAGGLAVALAAQTAAAIAPIATMQVAAAAVRFVASGASTGVVSAKVLALAQGALKTMLLSKLKTVTMMAIVLLGLAWGGGWIVREAVVAQSAQPEKDLPKRVNEPGAANAKGQDEQKAKKPPMADDAVAERTDRYGDDMPPGALARLGTVRWRHGGQINQFAVAPDGKTIATTGSDDAICLWDLATGKMLRSIKNVMLASGCGVAFSPDGNVLAAGGRKFEIRRWDTTKWADLPVWRLNSATAERMHFSPNGEFLACLGHTNGNRNAVTILDATTGKELHQLDGQPNYARPSFAFAPDGQTWAYADKSDKTIGIHESRSGKEIRRLEGHSQSAYTVAFSPDGRKLASTDGGTLRFWDTETGKLLPDEGKLGARYSLAYSPDGKLVACGSGVYDVATGEVRQYDRGPGAGRVGLGESDVLFSPDGKRVVSANHNCVQTWDGTTLNTLQADSGHNREVFAVSSSADGSVVASASGEWGVVRRWEATTGKPSSPFQVDNGYVYAVTYSPDGRTLAVGTGNKDGTIWLLEAETGKQLRTFVAPNSHVISLTFSEDGKSLLSDHGEDNRLWDVEAGKVLRTFPGGTYDGSVFALAPDGRTVAGGFHRSNAVTVWDAVTGNELRRLQLRNLGVNALAFGPDGKTLATGCWSKEPLKLWDATTGTMLWEAKDQIGVAFVAFSLDGKTLAAGGRDSDIRLWEVETGKERWRFEGPGHWVKSGAFSRDGKRLVTGSSDTTALVWDLAAPAGPKRRAPLSAQQLDELWGDMAGEDAKKAYRAVALLAETSAQVLPLLKKRFKVIPAADDPEIGKLVTGLDDDRFPVREEAVRKLVRLGAAAEPALRKSLSAEPTLETKRRIEDLLSKLDPRRSAEALRELRALEVLERIGNAEARDLIESMAAGPSGARRTQEAKASAERRAKRGAGTP